HEQNPLICIKEKLACERQSGQPSAYYQHVIMICCRHLNHGVEQRALCFADDGHIPVDNLVTAELICLFVCHWLLHFVASSIFFYLRTAEDAFARLAVVKDCVLK